MYKRYNKKYDYSYCLGAYPTIELLSKRFKYAIEVIEHSSFNEKSINDNRSAGRQKLYDLAKEKQINVRVNDRIVEKLSRKGNCYVIGFIKKYRLQLSRNNHLVLSNPSNTGNLGTILRTMLAFNCYDLAIIEPAVDIFYPETIRSSMGALFSIRFDYFSSWESYHKAFPNHYYYMMMTDGRTPLKELSVEQPYSLVFGNESAGLEPYYKSFGNTVRIEQSDMVDSINLAVSVGIALHHLSKGAAV